MNNHQTWTISINHNIKVCVPANINSVIPYTLLEQQDYCPEAMVWLNQYLKPDMLCLDLAANYGISTLIVAKQLTTGHVWCFEPSRYALQLLGQSLTINQLTPQVTLLNFALSESVKQVELNIASEIVADSKVDMQTSIDYQTLDLTLAALKISPTIAFVNLAVDTETCKLIKGADRFFSEQSPLVMLNFEHGKGIDFALIDILKQYAYSCYCLMPSLAVLVEFDQQKHSNNLTLFACKLDRAEYLQQQGLLLTPSELAQSYPLPELTADWQSFLAQYDFYQYCQSTDSSDDYQQMLQICANIEQTDLTAQDKLSLLNRLQYQVEDKLKFGSLAEHEKISWQLLSLYGHYRLEQRKQAVATSAALILSFQSLSQFATPFFPALRSDYVRPITGLFADWLKAVLLEFYEFNRDLSSFYLLDPLLFVDLIKDNQHCSLSMARRIALACMRFSRDIPEAIAQKIRQQQLDNQDIWLQLLQNTRKTGLIQQLLSSEQQVTKINILDIAGLAYQQQNQPYWPLLQAGQASLFVCLPDQATFQKLSSEYADNDNYRFFSGFIGKGRIETFYATQSNFASSVYKPNRLLIDAFMPANELLNNILEHPIKSICLDDVPDLGNVDLIKIQTHGAELDVLKGGRQVLDKALVVWTEISFLELYENQALFADIDQYLRAHGFQFHSFKNMVSACFKPLTLKPEVKIGLNQLISAEAVYIKDFQKLANLSNIQLRKLAVILDVVLNATDFAAKVMQEIDKRQNSRFIEHYYQDWSALFTLPAPEKIVSEGVNQLPSSATPETQEKVVKALNLQSENKPEQAAELFKEVLEIEPNNFVSLHSLSVIASHNDEQLEALSWIEKAIAAYTSYPASYFVQAVILQALGRFDESLASYQRAIDLDPKFENALINRSNLYYEIKQHIKALEGFAETLKVNPANDKALAGQAIILTEMNHYEKAIPIFENMLNVNPEFDYGLGLLLHAEQHCCDWRRFEQSKMLIEQGIREGKRVCKTLPFMSISNSPEDLFKCVRIFADHLFPARPTKLWQGQRYNHDKIRLAYISPDFREHPVGHLMVSVIENHDKTKFETIAISLGIDDNSSLRSRFINSFSQFLDFRKRKSWEIAEAILELEVDILVDLAGFTADSRTDVLAYRPAPIQVNFLGYPGSFGVEYMDYILADRVVIPEGHQQYYTEKVAYLANAYLPSDGNLKVSDRTPSREEMGLPPEGIIFCSFNHDYKINPDMFDVWMRILQQVPGSTLWLMKLTEAAQGHLRREAETRGVDASRLVFATRIPLVEDHLARYRLADLFLDTTPYNAHTTASDALCVGLPVITWQGNTFSGRVASSLLTAIGMPELITHSLAEYEALAVKLATDHDLLTQIKAKLREHKTLYPLFKTEVFCRDMEQVYIQMLADLEASL